MSARAWRLLLLLAASSAAASPPRKTRAAPPPLPISGDWFSGDGLEPPRGPLHLVSQCGSRPASIHLDEHDGRVEADVRDAVPMKGGAVHALPSYGTAITERLHGAFDGRRLTLAGTHDVVHTPARAVDGERPPAPPPADTHEPVRIELRFSPRSGHFVGTRNGAPIWLARGIVSPGAGSCPP